MMNALISKVANLRCPDCDTPVSFREAERTVTIPWFFNFRRENSHRCKGCPARLKLVSRYSSWISFLRMWMVLAVQAAGMFGILIGSIRLFSWLVPNSHWVMWQIMAILAVIGGFLFWIVSLGLFLKKDHVLEKLE